MANLTALELFDRSGFKSYEYLYSVVKKDEELVDHVFITCLSAFTDRPLSLGVLAPTSEGKTYVVSSVKDLFPEKYIVTFTGASPKSLFYQRGRKVLEDGTLATPALTSLEEQKRSLLMQEKEMRRKAKSPKSNAAERQEAESKLNIISEQVSQVKQQVGELQEKTCTEVNLSNLILVFLEPPEAGLWNALKPLLSHDAKSSNYWTVDRNNGGNATRKIILRGWPAVIFCSAKSEQDQWNIWDEIESRCTVVSPSHSEEKYAEANRLTADRLGLPAFIAQQKYPTQVKEQAKLEVSQLVENVLNLVGEDRNSITYNPFRNWCAEVFPRSVGKHMRSFEHLMAYANISALEDIQNRPKLVDNNGKVLGIVVTLADIDRAFRLAFKAQSTSLPPDKLKFFEDVVIPAWESSQAAQSELNVALLMERANAVGYKMGGSKLRKRYLESLENAGLILAETSRQDKRANKYVLTPISKESGTYGQMQFSHNIEARWLNKAWNELQSMQPLNGVQAELHHSGRVIVEEGAFYEAVLCDLNLTGAFPSDNALNGSKTTPLPLSAVFASSLTQLEVQEDSNKLPLKAKFLWSFLEETQPIWRDIEAIYPTSGRLALGGDFYLTEINSKSSVYCLNCKVTLSDNNREDRTSLCKKCYKHAHWNDPDYSQHTPVDAIYDG
jgi:hypothetical protein